MASKYPPKGYKGREYPLPHNFNEVFALNGENEAKNSTIVSLLRTSEVATGAEAIEVNPRNANFAEDNGPLIHMNSIVPRINLTIKAYMTKNAEATDSMRRILFNWMPIYISFLDTLEAMDSKTGTQIEDILELQHETTNKDTYPLYSGTDLGVTDNVSLSSVGASEAFGDYGLTTDAKHESVAFSKEDFYDTLQYKTNGAMLRKVTGPMRTGYVTRDRAYLHHSNNFTYPSVKRGNEYTFCGILIHLPQGSEADQVFLATDTTDIAHLNVSVSCRYDEWNADFDQTAL